MKVQNETQSAGGADSRVSRRRFIQAAGTLGVIAGLRKITPAGAQSTLDGAPELLHRSSRARTPTRVNLHIDHMPFGFAGRRAIATMINGSIPGPLLRFREGDTAEIHVTNNLREDTSIHWHGLLLPNAMDGVPGVTFPGIHPKETFVYEFPLRQNGTYWYHSHSGMQEQQGHYGPLIIDAAKADPFQYDREYVVMLSDWSFEDPHRVLDNIKKQSSYYNFQRRTLRDFFKDMHRNGLRSTVADRMEWARMRMTPTDIADITGSTYTYLLNGLPPAANWTGLFRPGERVRLRFINASAGTFFDVRIPGLEMTVVQVSGQNVQPVATDEFRIEIAQTFDVIVQPTTDQAYTIFSESMDRSGFARGTLAPRGGMSAVIPDRRKRPTLTLTDMGMAMSMGDHNGMSMAGMDMPAETRTPPKTPVGTTQMTGHDMATMGEHAMPNVSSGFTGVLRDGTIVRSTNLREPGTVPAAVMHGGDTHGVGSASPAMESRSRLHEPGAGLGEDGWRVLVYTDLKRLNAASDFAAPAREFELHLTGNMERYMWSINGIKFSDAPDPILLTHGERIRLTIVNDTMMAHPMHMHGMYMELENGHGNACPLIHTINVKPAERVSLLITPVDSGSWAFHCHIMLHMEVGMFRVFKVLEPAGANTKGNGERT